MEISEARRRLAGMSAEIDKFGDSLDLEALNDESAANEAKMVEPDFWQDNVAAQKVIDENNVLKGRRDNYLKLANSAENVEAAIDLLSESYDEDMATEMSDDLEKLSDDLSAYRLTQLLNEPYDKNNEILEIHPGSGGTESADWGANLQRMYTRWAEQHGFKVDIMDYHPGDVAGVDSVTLMITGHNAYGYLRSERGVHRFVRISPFDSAGRRHTSFVSIDVMPELDDSVEVIIYLANVKITVYSVYIA